MSSLPQNGSRNPEDFLFPRVGWSRVQAIHDGHASEEQEQARAKREARAQVDRMGDTLRTLNGIFKTMQARDGVFVAPVMAGLYVQVEFPSSDPLYASELENAVGCPAPAFSAFPTGGRSPRGLTIE